jgi:hypothetical protein
MTQARLTALRQARHFEYSGILEPLVSLDF